ncbi:MAPEG family protein [Stappia indica]|uniref:MAPEG family protein n=1 Tax=Stappia indica TaxID=538381 RepID=UPI001CD5B09C|nr:MAPEG family protein [Stappia indica]MCA1298987.1 MAPEG family protein [Stappia indica]
MCPAKTLTALGDGGDPVLLRRIRVQGNCVEDGSTGVTADGAGRASGRAGPACPCAGTMLLGGRLLHAYGLSQVDELNRFRGCGMTLTFFSIGFSALTLVWLAFG